MSQRLQMLQVARLARRTLGEAADLVVSFLESLAVSGGGYCNRGGRQDLYYTSFALDALVALDALPTGNERAKMTRSYLDTFGDGSGLDFVHRCCLARAWASQPADAFPADRRAGLLAGVTRHRAADGGYNSRAGAARGTAYGCFLAINACADLRQPFADSGPEAEGITACVQSLRAADGGWSNAGDQPEGSTTATAAAIATLRSLGRPVPHSAREWLLARRHPAGGFSMPSMCHGAIIAKACSTSSTRSGRPRAPSTVRGPTTSPTRNTRSTVSSPWDIAASDTMIR